MKICVISNLYPPNARGGAEQVVSKTVDGLISVGHSVVVITTTKDREWCEKTNKLSVYRFRPKNLYYYTYAHQYNCFFRFFWHLVNMFNIQAVREVRDILEKEKPDVVHTHNLMGLSFLIPRLIRKMGLYHVHTVHDVQLVEPSGIILKSKEKSFRYNGFPTKIYSAITSWLFGSPDVVISPSKFLYKFYSQRAFFPRSQFVVLRNPITFGVSLNSKEYNKPEEFQFVYIGQVEDHKGTIFLTEVFKELNSIAKLHIVGSGSALNRVKEIALKCNNIKIHGRLNRNEVGKLFKKSNMTIVPSRCYENSPTVIFESFYFGVPVLASNIEGIEELIDEGKNGITFVADNPNSLKEKILWCVEHVDEIAQMGIKTSTSLEGLSEKDYIESLNKLYFVK